MNRLGMMVDLSHTSHDTMRDVLRMARSPVMFSHYGCYALAKNYRNVPDDVLEGLKSNGGVVMVMFVKRFFNADSPESANMETAVDHIFITLQKLLAGNMLVLVSRHSAVFDFHRESSECGFNWV